ncbi:MAG: hypothetical protein ACI4RI_02075 [Ruminococcus sp.]
MVCFFIFVVGIIIFIFVFGKGIIQLQRKEEKPNKRNKNEEYVKKTINRNTGINNNFVSVQATIVPNEDEEKQIDVDYRKNSWKFYCYDVFGTNPKTNRKKKVSTYVLSNDENYIKEKSGLINVTEIKETFIEPSEAQIDYAKSLGIQCNSDLNRRDYSILISRALGELKYQAVPLEVAQFAERFNVYLSSYATMSIAYNIIYDAMDKKEKCLFLAHTVFQLSNGFSSYDYIKHPSYQYYEDFANEYLEDENVGKIMNNYIGSGFIPNKKIIKKIKPYKICYNYFVRIGLISEI